MKKIKTTLLQEISTHTSLGHAWATLNKANKQSRGFNNETIEKFQSNLDQNIKEISKKLKAGTFRFNSTRAVLIPKRDRTKYRPLVIQDIGDRLVCKAIAIKLDEILTPIFNLDNEASFAYRKGKGVEGAILKMVQYYSEGHKIILEADIENFFNTINQDILLKQVFNNLPDNTLNVLVKEGINQEIGNMHENTMYPDYFNDLLNGVPQGNALSPLFANVYLAEFDKSMIKSGYKLIRYADDFIVLCKDKKSALEALTLSKKILEQNLDLKIHPIAEKNDTNAKTKIVDPVYDKFQFLSIRFDGKELWVDPQKIIALKEKIREVTNEENYYDLVTVLTKTRNLLEGWLASFKFINLDRHVKEIDDYVDLQIYNIFRKFGFNIMHSDLREIKDSKGRKKYALSPKQRSKTGVHYCNKYLEKMRPSIAS